MNREIKFRCWIPERVFSESIKQDAYMAAQGDPDLETLSSFIHHYGDEPTLMQFTGLKDKGGKDIYEGDVLKSKPYLFDGKYIVGKVIWSDNKAMWLIEEINPVYNETDYLHEVLKEPHETEIIGNIHQNPELLNP